VASPKPQRLDDAKAQAAKGSPMDPTGGDQIAGRPAERPGGNLPGVLKGPVFGGQAASPRPRASDNVTAPGGTDPTARGATKKRTGGGTAHGGPKTR
jgi:hypothetical protein